MERDTDIALKRLTSSVFRNFIANIENPHLVSKNCEMNKVKMETRWLRSSLKWAKEINGYWFLMLEDFLDLDKERISNKICQKIKEKMKEYKIQWQEKEKKKEITLLNAELSKPEIFTSDLKLKYFKIVDK